MSDSTVDNFNEQLAEAIELGDSGKYKKALTSFNKLVKAFPNEPQAYFERAMILLNLDKNADAILDLEKSLALNPVYPGAQQWLSVACASDGKTLIAAELKLKSLIPTGQMNDWSVSPQGWADCASMFLEAEQLERAKQVLEQYFTQYESKVKAYSMYTTAPWRIYASVLLTLGDSLRALEFAERAVKHEKRVPADEFTWISCLASAGQIELAMDEFEKRKGFEGTTAYNQTKAVLAKLAGQTA